jgi:hypothetical protein
VAAPVTVTIVRGTDVERTGRVRQVEGIFDLPPTQRAEQTWTVDLPLPDKWNIGLIVGPSGSGKSTILRECFGELPTFEWDDRKSILDGFPQEMKVQDVVALLSSVGFSSPPAWLRPFNTLSNGEQFRVQLARTLTNGPGETALVDEFTSVVDRTVAKVGSAAVAKAVRRSDRRLVAASCHYDVIDWLQPDWIYDTATGRFSGRSLQRRPTIDLEIHRAPRGAWRIFRHHHYLNTSLATSAKSFIALVDGQPAAFHAGTHFVHPKVRDMMRGHRTVCLPDFQGVGIGNALQDFCASIFTAIGWRYVIIASHPAVTRSMARSKVWDMSRKPGFVPQPGRTTKGTYGRTAGKRSASAHSQLRMTASFTYVGPPAAPEHVEALAADLPRPKR